MTENPCIEPDKVEKVPVGFDPLPLVTVKVAVSEVDTLPDAGVNVLLTDAIEPFTPLIEMDAFPVDKEIVVVLEEEMEKV